MKHRMKTSFVFDCRNGKSFECISTAKDKEKCGTLFKFQVASRRQFISFMMQTQMRVEILMSNDIQATRKYLHSHIFTVQLAAADTSMYGSICCCYYVYVYSYSFQREPDKI